MRRRTGSGGVGAVVGMVGMVGMVGLAVGGPGCKDPLPPQEDATLPLDAPVDARACALPGDCRCFSNYDCPATHACVSQDPDGISVSCVEGPRGSGAPGAACTGAADCASALCVDGATAGRRCSDLCTVPSMCPPELPRCSFVEDEGICAR